MLLDMKSDPNYFFKQDLSSISVIGFNAIRSDKEVIDGVFIAAVRNGNHSIIEMLLDQGIGVYLCHLGLIVAMQRKDKPLVSLIVQKGIRSSWLMEELGPSVLFCAAQRGHADVVQCLLDGGIDANTRSTPDIVRLHGNAYYFASEETTPLYFAVVLGHEAVVRALLGSKADPNIRSPILRAMKKGHATVVEALLQHGAKFDIEEHGFESLLEAARDGHRDLVQFLLRKGVPLELKSSKEKHPFFEAISNKRIGVLQFLLERGVGPDIVNELGQTGLILATASAQPKMVDLLLQHGANAKLADNLGFTPLLFAVLSRNFAVAKILLENGNTEDAHRMTCAGRSPLSVAQDFNLHEIVCLLSGKTIEGSNQKEHLTGPTFIADSTCDTCHRPIYDMEEFFQCPICSSDSLEILNVCLECVTGELGCYDRLHTLTKMEMVDGKPNMVGKTSRWRQHALPIRPSST